MKKRTPENIILVMQMNRDHAAGEISHFSNEVDSEIKKLHRADEALADCDRCRRRNFEFLGLEATVMREAVMGREIQKKAHYLNMKDNVLQSLKKTREKLKGSTEKLAASMALEKALQKRSGF